MRRLGLDVTWLPTTLFGRHPGWGDPGGGATPADHLSNMWDGILDQVKRHGRNFDAVMTGYMGASEHVSLSAKIIDHLRPSLVLVDPVMGDGRLYVDEARAHAICDHLLPRAHICTPNLWEWRFITGAFRESAPRAPSALTGVRETLVTSVPGADAQTIGAQLFIQSQTSDPVGHEIVHERFETVPNGGGDALAAAYLAHRLKNRAPEDSLARSISAIFKIMQAADESDAGELPIVREQSALCDEPLLSVNPIQN